MTCWSVKRRTTAFLDRRLSGDELARVEAHLRRCSKCEIGLHDLEAIRCSLRQLPKAKTPGSLTTRLRVMASQERRLILEADGSRIILLWNEWKFRFQQMMRPLTIPATGGLCSAMVLFSSLLFTIGTTTRGFAAYEVPVFYSSNKIDANLLPVELRTPLLLKMSLDSNGHITDYNFHNESSAVQGDASSLQHQSIEVPDIPSVMKQTQPVESNIQISLTPMDYRK